MTACRDGVPSKRSARPISQRFEDVTRERSVRQRIRDDSLVFAEAWTYACLLFASYHHERIGDSVSASVP